ncbi:hypothetical protein BKH46_04700 [Helicobacter sp. 12S02634-8]|uniref:GtrA family protein n=1 Tax=Helicobacter sp. 12S02634-8 TaxID=1476199 RepID=UPI000BA4F5F2|nr:GtrA family protein [Helicobacter sp. 12S02634-8]PAF47382.1 hypothetical protein BKH46_04700 [Helicobacter sp. 12S02634-8]
MKSVNSLLRYLLVGGVNTALGFGVIFALMYVGWGAELANLLGYICGLICSYLLNKTFTFKSKNPHKRDFLRFLLAMGIAYGVNLLILLVCYRLLHINAYLSQIIAGVAYTLSGYCLSKFWAFKSL